MALTQNQLERLLKADQLVSLFKVLLINDKLSCLFNFKEPEDVTLSMVENETLEICVGFTPVKKISPGKEARLILPEVEDKPIPPNVRAVNIVVKILDPGRFPKLSELTTNMLNSLNNLNLLDTTIGKYVRVNIRKYGKDKNGKDELHLHPRLKAGDLVHKEAFLYALNLTGHDRLILFHIQGIWFCAIAYFVNHEVYVKFLDNFISNFITSI